jgi:hypothetical protein
MNKAGDRKMAIEVILHIHNADPILAEIDELPKPNDTLLKVMNPRLRDGKDIHYMQANVVTCFWPVHQLTFIEILPSEEEEQIVGFVRE